VTSTSLATNCKPALGYGSKGAAAIALKAQGLTWPQVGNLLGISDRQASSLACRTRQRAAKSVRTVELSGNVFLDLEREARRRGTSPDALAAQLLHHVVVDKLYNAILD